MLLCERRRDEHEGVVVLRTTHRASDELRRYNTGKRREIQSSLEFVYSEIQVNGDI